MVLSAARRGGGEGEIQLSSTISTQTNLLFIMATRRPKHSTLSSTREVISSSADLAQAHRRPDEAGAEGRGIDVLDRTHAALVGGMMRNCWLSRRRSKSIIGQDLAQGREPDEEVVAVGAGHRAGVLKGEVKDILLLDVTPLSLGIRTKAASSTPLIERNTTIRPRIGDVHDAEDNAALRRGGMSSRASREMATFNKTLGKFELVGIPPAPRGMPQVEVMFDIDANGTITVSAEDPGHGKPAADPDRRRLGSQGGRGPGDDPRGRVPRGRSASASRGRGRSQPGRVDRLRDGEEPRRASRNARRGDDLDHRVAARGGQDRARRRRRERDPRQDRGADRGVHRLAQAVYEKVQAEQQATAGASAGNGSASEDEVVEEADYEVIDEEEEAKRS